MNDPLAPLRQRFRARAAEDLKALRRLAAEDLTHPELRRLAHNIAGAAGTFGFPSLSTAAARIDDILVEGATPGAAELSELEAELEAAAGS